VLSPVAACVGLVAAVDFKASGHRGWVWGLQGGSSWLHGRGGAGIVMSRMREARWTILAAPSTCDGWMRHGLSGGMGLDGTEYVGRLDKKGIHRLDLSRYKGVSQFGRAWQYVMEHDPHASGSVDRMLLTEMVRLCPDTHSFVYRGFTSAEVRADADARPELTAVWERVAGGRDCDEDRVEAIAAFTAGLADGFDWEDMDQIAVGGTEEQIIARGSDWCADVVRVACLLYQIGGMPSRIVYLFNLADAYCGHCIVEVHRNGRWGAVDTSTALAYRQPDGRPASTWDLKMDPALIEAHRPPGASYTSVGQFAGAGVVDYSLGNCSRYNYAVNGLDEYCRSILEMANQGWPGGFRWLHGEDEY